MANALVKKSLEVARLGKGDLVGLMNSQIGAIVKQMWNVEMHNWLYKLLLLQCD